MKQSFGLQNEKQIYPARNNSRITLIISVLLALAYLTSVWYVLDAKLLLGDDWISATYDHSEWRTNEGNLPTYGAWDLETHIWKTKHLMDNFPNYQWSPDWYMGMPLFEYYQLGFYAVHAALTILTGLSLARSALVLILFGHLLATFMTFFLCFAASRRVLVSALSATFILANTFLTLRSYGWEPITVVFLFLYPLGLLFFLRDPLHPFRLSIIITLAVAYLSHPLIFFSLLMYMGLYLLAISLRREENPGNIRYFGSYFATIIASVLVSAVQFIPQITYSQVTSGAHMGLKYLPFYHIPYNIITPWDFFFDAGNLKGPGPIIMIAVVLFVFFSFLERRSKLPNFNRLTNNKLIVGTSVVLFVMVLFYYMQLFNIFPMNLLRSIQYHRIIPEFMITSALLVASLSNITFSFRSRVIYYSLLIGFVVASSILVYNIQTHWETTDSIGGQPEFIDTQFSGRISFPYTDQSFAVRNSFNYTPQTYGYYEQGITNPYADELFSISSGFHEAGITILYLKAANVKRLYVNMNEGTRDKQLIQKMNNTLPLIITNNTRYGYYDIPIQDASFAQTVSFEKSRQVQQNLVGCRILFKETYCGSNKEEFVSVDRAEQVYLASYVGLLEYEQLAQATFIEKDPDHYSIKVVNATSDTAIVVKMTHDTNFIATLDQKKIPIETIGPSYMLIYPQQTGTYTIELVYHTSPERRIGMWISIITIIALVLFFLIKPRIRSLKVPLIPKGDMK